MRQVKLLVLMLLLLLPALGHAQAPVQLQEVSSYVVIHSEGNAVITYSLTFKDLQGGRNEIKTLGPFTPSHKILSSSGVTGGRDFTVTLDSLGGGKYQPVPAANLLPGLKVVKCS